MKYYFPAKTISLIVNNHKTTNPIFMDEVIDKYSTFECMESKDLKLKMKLSDTLTSSVFKNIQQWSKI